MKQSHLNIWRAAAITAALVLLGIGISRGEADIVLRKAMRICLECIGVG